MTSVPTDFRILEYTVVPVDGGDDAIEHGGGGEDA
jgi:hypothetical protein